MKSRLIYPSFICVLFVFFIPCTVISLSEVSRKGLISTLLHAWWGWKIEDHFSQEPNIFIDKCIFKFFNKIKSSSTHRTEAGSWYCLSWEPLRRVWETISSGHSGTFYPSATSKLSSKHLTDCHNNISNLRILFPNLSNQVLYTCAKCTHVWTCIARWLWIYCCWWWEISLTD